MRDGWRSNLRARIPIDTSLRPRSPASRPGVYRLSAQRPRHDRSRGLFASGAGRVSDCSTGDVERGGAWHMFGRLYAQSSLQKAVGIGSGQSQTEPGQRLWVLAPFQPDWLHLRIRMAPFGLSASWGFRNGHSITALVVHADESRTISGESRNNASNGPKKSATNLPDGRFRKFVDNGEQWLSKQNATAGKQKGGL